MRPAVSPAPPSPPDRIRLDQYGYVAQAPDRATTPRITVETWASINLVTVLCPVGDRRPDCHAADNLCITHPVKSIRPGDALVIGRRGEILSRAVYRVVAAGPDTYDMARVTC